MSDIKAGDWVVVVRARTCCGVVSDIGRFFTVSGFFPRAQCAWCGTTLKTACVLIDGKWEAKEIWRLIKIDPDAIHIADELNQERGRKRRVTA